MRDRGSGRDASAAGREVSAARVRRRRLDGSGQVGLILGLLGWWSWCKSASESVLVNVKFS